MGWAKIRGFSFTSVTYHIYSRKICTFFILYRKSFLHLPSPSVTSFDIFAYFVAMRIIFQIQLNLWMIDAIVSWVVCCGHLYFFLTTDFSLNQRRSECGDSSVAGYGSLDVRLQQQLPAKQLPVLHTILLPLSFGFREFRVLLIKRLILQMRRYSSSLY